MNPLLNITRNPITRMVCLCVVANSFAACGTIESAPYRGRTVRGSVVQPYMGDREGTLRVGAHIATSPYERPYLRQPAGRHPGAPPYGLAVGRVIGARLREARIPSAPATSYGGRFDTIANIYPGPLRETFGRDGHTAEAPFDIEIRAASGRTTSRIHITGFGTSRTGFGDPVRASLEDAGVKIARAIADASISSRPASVERFPGQDADSLSNAGVASFQSEDYARALQYFDGAIEIEPSHQAAWTYRGAAFVKMGQPEEGRRSLERAISIQPGSAEAEQARKWLTRL